MVIRADILRSEADQYGSPQLGPPPLSSACLSSFAPSASSREPPAIDECCRQLRLFDGESRCVRLPEMKRNRRLITSHSVNNRLKLKGKSVVNLSLVSAFSKAHFSLIEVAVSL